MSDKITVANEWLGGICSGCEMSLLGMHEKLIGLLEKIEISYSPVLMDAKEIPKVDVALLTGGIRSEDDIEKVKEIREKSDRLIALGTCATWGGVPSLGNLSSKEELLQKVYVQTTGVSNPKGQPPSKAIPDLTEEVSPVRNYVKVDYEIPGCPPNSDLLHDALRTLIRGGEPTLPDETVCDECAFDNSGIKIEEISRWRIEKDVDREGPCLLSQGILCLGGATVAGCGAKCPQSGVPCMGCAGPHPEQLDQGAEIIRILSNELSLEEYPEVDLSKVNIKDAPGSFYMFSLASSLLNKLRGGRWERKSK